MFICFFTSLFLRISKKKKSIRIICTYIVKLIIKRGKENEEVIFKVLVLLVLMVSFFAIGCEKDKSSEVAQQYEAKIKDFEDYQKSAKIVDSFETFVGRAIEALEPIGEEPEEKPYKYELSAGDIDEIKNIVLSIIGYNKTVNIDSPKGTIEGKRTLKENGIEMTISLKDISIKYKEVEENENTEAEQKGLIISFDHFAMQTLSIARSA